MSHNASQPSWFHAQSDRSVKPFSLSPEYPKFHFHIEMHLRETTQYGFTIISNPRENQLSNMFETNQTAQLYQLFILFSLRMESLTMLHYVLDDQ